MKAIAFSAIRGYPRYHSLMSTNSLQQNLFTSDEYGAAKVRDALNRCTLKISQRYPISTADATFYEFLEVMNDAVSIPLISLMPTNNSFSSIYSCLEIRAIEVRKSRCINWCGIFRRVIYWEILQNGEIMCHFWNLVAKASAPGGVVASLGGLHFSSSRAFAWHPISNFGDAYVTLESIFAKRCNSIFYPFFHSFSRTWRGAGNKKNSRHRTKGTEIEDNGWVSVAVYFSYFRREVWIFFFRGERRAQVIWLTLGTATAGVFGPRQGY